MSNELLLHCVVDNQCFLFVYKGDISTDDRSYEMHLANAMDVASTNVYFYPRLIPIVSSHHSAAAFMLLLVC